MEDLVKMNSANWQNRSVLISGHTGFKGGWLTLWLYRLGAKVHGYALDPPTAPSLFEAAKIRPLLASHSLANLADFTRLQTTFDMAQPEVVFHLAAQPLVREGYRDPLGTLSSNVMGTAHLLEAARNTPSVQAIVVITTDKVYENREWEYPYREIDALGGHDPYSASKAAAEIVVASYRASFFGPPNGHSAQVATARAGNVIGGGDWAADRLVPDCLRAFTEGDSVRLRFPSAVRPWQHVLEPLAGYLLLAEELIGAKGKQFAKAWNFGPDTSGDATVGEVAEATARCWGKSARIEQMPLSDHLHEAGLLRLDSTRARCELGWQPRWTLQHALEQTVAWHQTWRQGADMTAFSLDQIRAYEECC